MTDRIKRIWIGLFVLLAMGLLGVMIILFGSAPTLFKRTQTYYVRFSEAPGVTAGTPVRRSGVRIGEVSAVELNDEEGTVRVTLAIEPKYTLRHSDDAVLITGLLGSDASIDFVARRAEPDQPALDRSPIAPGTEIVGIRQPTVNTVIKQASGMMPEAQDTLKDVRKSMQRIERSMPLVDDTLKEVRDLAKEARQQVPGARKAVDEIGDLARDLRKALPGFTKTSDEFRELAIETRKMIPEARRVGDDLGAAVRSWGKLGERLDVLVQANQDKFVKVLENLNEALTRVADTFGDSNQKNIAEILKNVRVASGNLDSIARNVDTITTEGRTTVRQLNDTLKRTDGVLRNMDVITTEGQTTVRQLNETLKRLDGIARNVDVVITEGQATVRQLNDTLKRADGLVRSLQSLTDGQSGRIANILKNLDEGLAKVNAVSVEKLNHALSDVRELVRAVGQSDGTLSRLLTDPGLYNHLDETVQLIPKLIPRLERILKDFETFADKLARHPEAIGLGGVVRPDSGLKEPPSRGAWVPPPGQPMPSYYPPSQSPR